MGFFDRIFNTNTPLEEQPDIRFGRYSDAYKSSENYEYWDQALDLFDQKSYHLAYEHFFKFLYDEEEKNVSWKKNEDQIEFSIFQGSKVIRGTIDDKFIRVETKVAQIKVPGVSFMRRLVEKNYDLKYCRFALDNENHIVLVFTSFILDCSPYKLYYATKELSTQADKIDDLLLDEFDVLKPVDADCITDMDVEQKEDKYEFIKSHIQEVLDYLTEHPIIVREYPGGMAYLMLDLCYKLDCLVRPEGFMMESLERIHRLYFAKNTKKTVEKNKILFNEYRKLLDRSKADYFKEMYDTKSTFGITTPVDHYRVKNFIEGEIYNMDWYNENGYPEVALAVPGYIIGYCMFNFAVPKPIRDLFILYYQIIEHDYFVSLGYTIDYSSQGLPQSSPIKKALTILNKRHRAAFPFFDANIKNLNFDSKQSFARSYLLMIRELNLNTAVS